MSRKSGNHAEAVDHEQLSDAYRAGSNTGSAREQCCTIPGTRCLFRQRQDLMRSRLVILVAVVIAATAVIFAVSRLFPSSVSRVAPAQLPSTPASYLGVYEAGALKTYQPVADFTKAADRQPNLVGYYSGWGEPFETSFAETARQAWRGHYHAVGSHPRLGLEDRRRRL